MSGFALIKEKKATSKAIIKRYVELESPKYLMRIHLIPTSTENPANMCEV